MKPRLIVLGNLFRDQLDRYGELEHLADEWAELVAARAGATGFALNADDPLIADLGRDRDLARRPGVTYFGIDDPSQALPELQHAFDAKHCRRCGAPYVYERAFVGHLGHYSCPSCDADRPRPDVAATRIELEGMRGSRVAVRAPEGEIELRLPLPGLYNVYNALAALTAALRLGIPLERAARALGSMEAVFGRVETIEVDGKPVSILLIKNPAGANEVLRTLLLEANASGDGAASTSGSPSTTGSPTAGTSPGSGTRTSSCWPARSARWPARAPGPPRWRCASSTPACHRRRSRSRRRSTARSIERSPRPTARCSRCPPTRPCSSSAPCWRSEAWRGGTGRELGGHLARGRMRRLRGGPPRLGAAGGRVDGPVLELGCGTGRVALHLAGRGHEVWAVDADAALLEALQARAAAQGLSVRAVCADVRALELDREFELILAPMQLLQMLGSAAARRAALERAAGHLAPGGRLAAAIVEPPSRHAGRPCGCPSRRPGARRLGLLEPPGRPRHRRRRPRDPPAPAGGVPRRLAERGGAHDRLDALDADALEAEAATVGLRPAGRLEVPPADGYLGSTVVVLERP